MAIPERLQQVLLNSNEDRWYRLAVLVVSCAMGGSCSIGHAQGTERTPRPNLLLILTDDQGWGTLGCYGGTKVPTPHLDRLAEEGARFTDGYVTSQCTPTRATLLTGQYTARHGLWHVLPWYGYPYARMTEPMFAQNFSRKQYTLAKGLREAGYRTAIVGKWHLTANADGNYMGLHPNASSHYGFDHAPPILTREHFAPGADRGVEELTTQALAFIAESKDKPWFCFLSHHMIHGKVVAPDDITARYRERGYGDDGPDRAVYLAGLECIDRSIGRLRQGLEELGEADETLILFLGDNGGIDERLNFKEMPSDDFAAQCRNFMDGKPREIDQAVGGETLETDGSTVPTSSPFPIDLIEYDNAPLRAGKGSTYEGGIRVPWIAWWPGHIESGAVFESPVHAVDILPTLLEFAGGSSPESHVTDGQSLLPMLTRKESGTLQGRPIFQYYPFYDLRWGTTPNASIRVRDYKLIEFFGDRVTKEHCYVMQPSVELYHLRSDIGENHDLASREPERVRRMRARLHEWIDGLSARTPQINPHFDPERPWYETREKPPWLKDAQWSPAKPQRHDQPH